MTMKWLVLPSLLFSFVASATLSPEAFWDLSGRTEAVAPSPSSAPGVQSEAFDSLFDSTDADVLDTAFSSNEPGGILLIVY